MSEYSTSPPIDYPFAPNQGNLFHASWGGFGVQVAEAWGMRSRYLLLPYWFLAVGTSVLPAARGVAAIRRRRRNVAGFCPKCGYDLRGTPDQCPECGAKSRSQPVA